MRENLLKLADQLKGHLHVDELHRGVYATDASIYQIMPMAVVYPKDVEDVRHIVDFASEHKVALLARGGGTSLAGQTVSEGIVLDFTTYMHAVIEYDPGEQTMRVQPGITRDEVNRVAKQHGLEFAPDPATSSRATVGGMVANNSSGTKSILYGKTIDHVEEVTVMLADGSVLTLGNESLASHIDDRLGQLHELTQAHANAIKERFPKTMRRVNGYCLDELLVPEGQDTWQPFKLFIGSEGTLGIILEVVIKLVPLPKCKAVAVVQFSDTIDAVRAVETMLGFQPAAVEILSDDLLEYSRKNLATKAMTEWIDGHPRSVQIVEFYADAKEDIEVRAHAMFEALRERNLGSNFALYHEGAVYDHVWSIRKKGLGLLMGEPNDKRGVAFIEDAAIPVDVLPEYIERVLAICARHEVDATYYAHASVGVIHVRPILDMRQQGDVDNMRSIAREVFDLVVEYGGAWSGEHGDGLVRSPFLPDYFGDEIYSLLKQVKGLFDPAGIMNPGKIIDAPDMGENLRYGGKYSDGAIDSVYNYKEQKSFHTAVHQCTGIGACRKVEGGTMCPSYMVTRDELHSTRGRANALRLAMSGQLGDGLHDGQLLEAIDLCLSCKACKSECPSSVDMARLKSEVLQMQYDKHGTSRRDRLIRDSAQMASRMSGGLAPVMNKVQGTKWFRSMFETIAGFDKRRQLPTYARESFVHWFGKNYKDQGHGKRVGLFADTYINNHEPGIGEHAVKVIQAMGYDIDLLEGCCQRPRISHGFLRESIPGGQSLMNKLQDYPNEVIAIEPGCVSAITDDLPDLVSGVDAKSIQSKVQPLGNWLVDRIDAVSANLTAKSNSIFLHGHCHQKALYGTEAIHHVFKELGADVYEPDSGCCGMSGSFGYEKEHYEISEKLARRVLLPALDEHPERTVVASGFSCRHQIGHFSEREVRHWIELLGSRG